MDTAKYKILKEALDNFFDIGRFKKFTREFFNGPDMLPATRQTGIWREYDDYVQCYYRIAEYVDENGNKLIVLAVELKKGRSVELARSMQRNFVSKILDTYDYNAAIVAFYSENQPNWRLSFVRLDYTLTEKGLDIDLTPARRYSYLVGEDEPKHTAEAQLFPLFKDDKSNPTLDEIEEAFSVERVTSDFFNQYKEKYLQLKEFLENDEKFISESERLGFEVEKFAEQFSKKLMGQLAFLYFIQKKGWLGVTLLPGDRELLESEYQKIYQSVEEANKIVLEKYFVKQSGKRRLNTILIGKEMTNHEADLLSDCFVETEHDMLWGTGNRKFISKLCEYCITNTELRFFNDYLEPFFYEGLNTKRKNDYYKRFNCKIPFLNGGLFEPLEGYHWKDVKFEIPNEIFTNKKDENDREADGIIDIFDRYNFTINENEPLEKEVAVDPEMLGKIFENLLEVTDRKSKGAFYTPREIVHYMCQESLINYLVNEVDVPYKDMREFILYGELLKDVDSSAKANRSKDYSIKDSILNNIGQIDKALENVRIADPAVGSGAFPLGMLNEIMKARNNITEYMIIKDKEGKFDRRYGENFIRSWRSPYKMKLDTIKNSIFAVDIEPSAVDIAKLRLWLSIIVEQEIDEEYPKPQPLPNLDSNILVGNSLIDEYEGIKLFDKTILDKHKIGNGSKEGLKPKQIQMDLLIDYTDKLLDEMFELQSRLFAENNENKKNEIKKEIDQIRDDLIIYTLEKNGSHEGLKKYNEFKDEKMKPYFIWELEFARVFQEKNGFDIVIGNPPYIGESGNKEIFRPIAKTAFGEKYYLGKMDIFYFFFHLALDIGNEKAEISYITTNYFITAFGAKKLRKDLKERSSIRRIINFNELKIFDSAKGQHNMITVLTKIKNEDIIAKTCLTNRSGNADSIILKEITNWEDKKSVYYEVAQDNLYEGKDCYIRLNGANGYANNSIESILNKISKLELRLGDIVEINQGVVSGCDYVSNRNVGKLTNIDGIEKNDGIFVLDLNNSRDVSKIKMFDNGENLLRDFYKNSDIRKYWCNTKPEKKLIYYEGKLDEKKYPDIMAHLLKYKKILYARIKTYNEKYHWTAIHRPRVSEIFLDPKIVVPYRSKTNTFAYNEVEWFCRSDVYVITQGNTTYNLKYLLALLNSKPYYIWLYFKGKRKGETLELFQKPLSEIPIKLVSQEIQDKFVDVVDDILDITIQDDYLTNFKKQEKVLKLENKIDTMVYDLYSFTRQEIEIIERFYKR